jgi:hypothetical protein
MEIRVAVTGAFLTGCPLRVRVGQYANLQTEIARALEVVEGQGWSVDVSAWRQRGTYYTGGGFGRQLPLVIAQRSGPPMLARASETLRLRPADEHAWLAGMTPGFSMELRSMRIDVYDLGMAVMNGTFAVEVPADSDLRAAAGILKRITWLKPDPESDVRSPIAASFQELATETVEQFAAAVTGQTPSAVQQAWMAPLTDAAPATDAGPPHDRWGRLLWLHPIHVLEVDTGPDDRTAIAAQLSAPFHRELDLGSGVFLPGIGWSTILTAAGSPDALTALRLTELHWAYYALYMEIDRGLLAVLDNDRWNTPEALPELEADADRVFGDYLRVMEARARLDSALASLGGDELAIWEAIADVQGFQTLVDAVERKAEVLQRVAERRVAQAAAKRERRIAGILSGLTALTVVTVVVALLGALLGSRADAFGHVELRVAIVAAAFVVTIGLYREAFRDRLKRSTRARARDDSLPRRR